MNWKIINQPLGMGDLSGGYAPTKKRMAAWVIPALMAATSIGSTVFGAAKSASANRKARAQVDSERAINAAERRRKMNENYIDTAAGQNMIRIAREEAKKIFKQAEGAAAVAGGTEASKQMAKDAGNKMMGDAIANIAAADAERKENIDERYRATDRQLAQQQIALDQQDALNKAQATSQMVSALGNAASSYLGASMGTGSPGGGGVTSTGAGSALNNMVTPPKSTSSTTLTSTPTTSDMQRIQAMMAYGHGVNNNYQLAAPIWRNAFLGNTK